MEDPGDDANSESGTDTYVERVVEHARHAILKAQGHLDVTSGSRSHAHVSSGGKRKR